MNVLLHSLLHDDPHQPGGPERERETEAADSVLAIGHHGDAGVVAMARLRAAKRQVLPREHAISAREDTYL
ncbi:MAG TPA: hypothetical protein PLW68_14345 [Casimicrobiaceae bacterium]|nr:hypothetical protein [Casimicrobiaceae bacterium]